MGERNPFRLMKLKCYTQSKYVERLLVNNTHKMIEEILIHEMLCVLGAQRTHTNSHETIY